MLKIKSRLSEIYLSIKNNYDPKVYFEYDTDELTIDDFINEDIDNYNEVSIVSGMYGGNDLFSLNYNEKHSVIELWLKKDYLQEGKIDREQADFIFKSDVEKFIRDYKIFFMTIEQYDPRVLISFRDVTGDLIKEWPIARIVNCYNAC